MLLYIDPGTGGAIFSGLSTLLAAIGGGVLVFLACLTRPIRSFFRRLWHAARREPAGGGEPHDRAT
jgi:hypothetical protein